MDHKDSEIKIRDHECFQNFGRWNGTAEAGYKVNFLGAKRKTEYQDFEISSNRVDSSFPNFDEEYFEWIDMLKAVLNSSQRFTIMELGAGYGRWSVNGAIAATNLGKDYRIIAVEGEPQHFKWLQDNIRNNSLDMNRCKLIQAAVSGSGVESKFYAGDSAGWYGQRILFSNDPPLSQEYLSRGVHFVSVKCITLPSLVQEEDVIDFVDMDVQGSELEIIQSTKKEIASQIKKIHIGTHSHEIEEGLRKFFHELGWISTYDYGCQGKHMTEYGEIDFVDGVQGWINPNF